MMRGLVMAIFVGIGYGCDLMASDNRDSLALLLLALI